MRALVPLELVVEETTTEPANLHIDLAGKLTRSTAGGGGGGGGSSGRLAGEIKQVAFASTPAGWAACDGAMLPKAAYPDLYAAIGDAFFNGSTPSTHFNLPDMRGRVVMGTGGLDGAEPRAEIGERGGAYEATLDVDNLPAHDHPFTSLPGTLSAATARATAATPDEGYTFARLQDNGVIQDGYTDFNIYHEGPLDEENAVHLAGVNADGTVGSTGGGQPVSIMQPYLALRFIIATTNG